MPRYVWASLTRPSIRFSYVQRHSQPYRNGPFQTPLPDLAFLLAHDKMPKPWGNMKSYQSFSFPVVLSAVTWNIVFILLLHRLGGIQQ